MKSAENLGVSVPLMACCAGPGSVKTAIWDKAQAHDLSRYQGTEYAGPLRKFVDMMVADGRRSHDPEHIGRCAWRPNTSKGGGPSTNGFSHMMSTALL